MALALGPIIGHVGGSKADARAVSAPSAANQDKLMATVEVPAGETWLVIVAGQVSTGGSSLSSLPSLRISATESKCASGWAALALEATGTVTIGFISTTATASFTGTLYTIKL